jgi:23S rRNA pseudouridine2605 synthase
MKGRERRQIDLHLVCFTDRASKPSRRLLSEIMADEKPTKRSGAPGGERPMRRRVSKTPTRDDARKKADSGKSKDGAPRGVKAAKPRPAQKRAKPAPAPVEKSSAFEGERIAKAMARAGVCSRRDAEDWIKEGRVAVNGVTLTSPAVNVTEADKIAIDGEPMQARERTRLFLFHKPPGLVTTSSDPEGRATVFAYLEEKHPELPRLVSVGRLDINTEGLLLLTNDGGLARTLELPATGWTRRYRVRVHGEIDQAQLDELKKGVTVDDVTYAPIDARLERVQGANAWIAMSLTEGKNREVKRVMEHLGLDVTRLIRVSYGPFQLGELAEGAVEEVKLKMLREQLGKSLAELAGVDFSSPLREATPAEKQEQREGAERRARKHVSVLRKQREEKAEKGPRARIERSATADRKGRAVAVERVTPTRRKPVAEEEAPSRNAKHFEAMRDGRRPRREEAESPKRRGASGYGREDRRSSENRRPRFEEERNERVARAPRERSEPQPRRAHGDVKAARDHSRMRPQDGAELRHERRAPRRDGEARAFRTDERGERQERPRRQEERPRKFDRSRGERDVGRAGEARAFRTDERRERQERPRRQEERPRKFDRSRSERDVARAGEARAFRTDERRERQERPRRQEERPRKFDRSRSERDVARAGEERKSQRPRAGAPRKGPPKGPPKGRGGSGKGPPKGPRRPRGE